MNRAEYNTIKKLNIATKQWRNRINAELDKLQTMPANLENFINVAYLNQYIDNLDKPLHDQNLLDRTYCYFIALEEYNKRLQ